MREEIEIWATKYTWEELSVSQQKSVIENIGKDAYTKLNKQFTELKKLDSPHRDSKKIIMGSVHKQPKPHIVYYWMGMAATLVLGLFLGSLQWDNYFFYFQPQLAVDTVYQKQIDTLQLVQYDTVYQTIWKEKVIVRNQVVNTSTTTPTVTEKQLKENYKVPAPEYQLILPKMEKEKNNSKIEVALEQQYNQGVEIDLLKK